MVEQIIQQIKQLTNRLENATSDERVDALQDLHKLVKQSSQASQLVGEFSLKRVLSFLKEQGSSEEYEEALDLIFRLVRNQDKNVVKLNSDIILGEATNVELLLDLLEHEATSVGIMSSQILTELHANNGSALETQIQYCPDGMNKLLQRLSDRTREEVRNQALALVQQLTSTNEQMKIQVVFNEGLDTIFNIIRWESEVGEAGLVVQDCLHICNNILNGSETCQRLFFGMGVEWVLRLADFFDPLVLESSGKRHAGFEDDDAGPSIWYEQHTRLACAILALSALYNALGTGDKKNQDKLVKGTSVVIPSAAFWIARRGPVQLVNAGLSLLYRVVDGNAEVARKLSMEEIKISPAQVGRNIPHGIDVSTLQFSWRPSHEDDRRLVSLLALLVERYVYPAETWYYDDDLNLNSSLHFECAVEAGAEAFASGCLKVFEKILSADSAVSDNLIQYVLAPPAMMDDGPDVSHKHQLESQKPLGLILFSLLVDGLQKAENVISQQQYGMHGVRSETVSVTERAANALTMVFVHGSSLAREIATCVTNHHISVHAGNSTERMALIPALLASAGRAMKIPGGGGHSLAVAVLRLLSTIACGCELAAKTMLEDPANLFVMHLATADSLMPPVVQAAVCFFLGCCYGALSDPQEGAVVDGQEYFTKKSFLGMIDARITISRFTDILKKAQTNPTVAGLFFSSGFRTFYDVQIEAVRSDIREHFAGASLASGNIDAAHQKLIDMQRERIAELEAALTSVAKGGSTFNVAPDKVSEPGEDALLVRELRGEIGRRVEDHEAEVRRLNALHNEQVNAVGVAEFHRNQIEAELADFKIKFSKETEQLRDALQASDSAFIQLKQEYALLQQSHSNVAEESVLEVEKRCQEYVDRLQQMSDEILSLKQIVVNDKEEMRRLQETVTQRDRKIDLLQSEVDSLVSSNDTAALDRKIGELESRNAQLKQQLWTVESEIQNNKKEEVSNFFENHSKDASSNVLESLTQSVTQFVLNLGLQLDEVPSLTTVEQREQYLEMLLNQCSEAINEGVNQCSDMAEGALLTNLKGGEGSVERFIDCCTRLSESVQEMSIRVEESDSLRVMLLNLESDLEEHRAARETAEADLLEVQDIRANLEAEHNRLVAECSSLKAQVTHLHSEGSEHDRNLFVRIDHLTQENSELQQHLTQLQAETAELKIALQSERASLSVQTEELSAARRDLEAASATISSYENTLQHVQSEHEHELSGLRSQLSAAEAEHSSDEHTKFAIQQQQLALIERLETEKETMTHELRELENAKQISDAVRDDLELQIQQLRVPYDELSSQNATLKTEIVDTLNSLSTQAEELISTKADLTKSIQDNTRLSGELNLLTQELETVRRNADENVSTNAALLGQLDELRSELAQLQEAAVDREASLSFDIERLTASLQTAQEDNNATSTALNTEIKRLQAELNTSSADTVDKEKFFEAQRQINELNVTLADLRAKVEHDSKIHTEALAAEIAHSTAANNKIAELHLHHQQITNELPQLKQQNKELETRLTDSRAACSSVEMALSKKTNQFAALSAEYDSLKAEYSTLQKSVAEERQRYERIMTEQSNNDPFKAQDNELRRLTGVADRLTKELQTKEQEMHTMLSQLRRKEGEAAGVKMALDSYKEDMELLRKENEALSTTSTADARMIKELQREISSRDSSLQMDRGELESLKAQLQSYEQKIQVGLATISQHSDLIVQADKKVKDLSTWVSSVFAQIVVSNSKNFDSHGNHHSAVQFQSSSSSSSSGTTALIDQIDLLRTVLESVASRTGVYIKELFDSAGEKEKQIADMLIKSSQYQQQLEQSHTQCQHSQQQLQQVQQQYQQLQQQLQLQQQQLEQQKSSTSITSPPLFENMVTPAKKSSSQHNGHISSVNDTHTNMLLTPITHSSTDITSISKSGNKSRHSLGLTVSPSAKDAARLNAEVMREKRKLSALQEQHSDLLGLLAQQEVEMNVFRKALEDRLSSTEFHKLESAAQKSVINLYGTYTDFRHYDGSTF